MDLDMDIDRDRERLKNKLPGKYIIDRFEGDFAVCQSEEKQMFNFRINELPNDAKEGSEIYLSEYGEIVLTKEGSLEANRREDVQEVLNELFE